MARVVHATSVHAAFDTRVFWKECRTLAAAGHDVTLVAPYREDTEREGVKIRGVRPPRGRLERMVSTVPAVIRTALRERPDVVHLHDPELLPFIPIVRRRGRVAVFDMHEDAGAAIAAKPWLPGPLRPVLAEAYRVVERLLLARTPTIFAEDSYARDRAFIGASAIVHNFPDLEELEDVTAERSERPAVGYMGAVSRGRGFAVTLEALERLAENGLPVTWECVGPINDPACTRILEQARRGLPDGTVRLHGRLPQREGWRMMATTHVGLALMQRRPNYVASYPTKMFEYMALGLPVLVSDFPLYRRIVEETGCGLCLDPGDAVAVADGIRWLHEHPAESARMGASGRRAVQRRYNWAVDGGILVDFYRQCLASRRSA